MKLILLILLVGLLLWLMYKEVSMESFDATTRAFVPVGEQRYGLRGDKLHPVSAWSRYQFGELQDPHNPALSIAADPRFKVNSQ